MKDGLRRRFWPEMVLGIVTAILTVVTLIQRNWIEVLFGVDPDQGNGTMEWFIVAGLAVATVALFALATHEWRRAATAA